MGGFRTSMMSPGFTMRDGFTWAPLMEILPFLHASQAMVRVLKMRTAHIHLSILASAMLFLVVLVHGDVDASQTETFDNVARYFEAFFHRLHIVFGEFT